MLACFNVWFTHHATTMNLNRLAKLMQTRWCCTLRTAWSVASWYVLNELAHPLLVHSCACLTTLPDGCRASDAAICHDEPTTQGTGEVDSLASFKCLGAHGVFVCMDKGNPRLAGVYPQQARGQGHSFCHSFVQQFRYCFRIRFPGLHCQGLQCCRGRANAL